MCSKNLVEPQWLDRMQLYLQRHYKGKSLLFGWIVSLTSKVSVPKYICQNKGVDGVWTHDLRFTRPTPYHLATTPCLCLFFCQLQKSWKVLSIGYRFIQKYSFRNERYFPQDQGMDGTRTHDLWFTRPTPCHLATTPLNSAVVPKVGVGTPLGVTRDFRWGPQNDFQNIVA